MAKLVFKKVSKVFPLNIWAVKDISFEVNENEFTVILGPSGCGKTTLLRLIAGLEEITSGEIWIDNVKVNNLLPKERNIAMVFQDYALYPHLSVFQNLSFPLKIRKYNKNKIQNLVLETAELLGIAHLLDRKPKELSGGERQRVALGRAIIRRPKVFLFDEPLSNLDAKLRIQMRAELKKLHQTINATIIYVTHDQIEAMTLGQRVAIMKDGKLHQVDKPLVIYSKPINQFVAGFLGSPPMNFIPGKIKNKKFVTDGWEWDMSNFDFKDKEEKIYLGIRPEEIEIFTKQDQIPSKWFKLKGQIEIKELLGPEIIFLIKIKNISINVRLKTDFRLENIKEVWLGFNPLSFHFFDFETGNNLFSFYKEK
ncbi:MAG: ABC transporter ATP-binding protein [Candidatus Aminicenantia bacterium]